MNDKKMEYYDEHKTKYSNYILISFLTRVYHFFFEDFNFFCLNLFKRNRKIMKINKIDLMIFIFTF